jgi:ribosomal protein S13
MAEGLVEGGKLITIDCNEDLEHFIHEALKSSDLGAKIEFKLGDALDIIPQLNETFDLVFIDADKSNYINYYELILPKVRPGGLIIADNVLWSGKVLDLENNQDLDTQVIHQFNELVHEDDYEKIVNLVGNLTLSSKLDNSKMQNFEWEEKKKILRKTSHLKLNHEILSLKAFLATEQRIPGFGNGLCQDVLWNARLHPKTKLKQLNKDQIEKLYNTIINLTKEIVELGGRDTETNLLGEKGHYHTKMSILGLKEACPECGSEIIKENYLGGSIYTCPKCQISP